MSTFVICESEQINLSTCNQPSNNGATKIGFLLVLEKDWIFDGFHYFGKRNKSPTTAFILAF
jgi:hypothetical protein